MSDGFTLFVLICPSMDFRGKICLNNKPLELYTFVWYRIYLFNMQ